MASMSSNVLPRVSGTNAKMTKMLTAAITANPAYVAAGPTAAWTVGSANDTAALAPKLVRVARAAARERAASGKTSPTKSQVMGPNEI